MVSPLVTTFREMREMRYLWREPLRMDNTRLIAVLGREPHTPLDEAVEATLLGLGCIQ
jgi:nucleoside-diphosphate-sugar epimerase